MLSTSLLAQQVTNRAAGCPDCSPGARRLRAAPAAPPRRGGQTKRRRRRPRKKKARAAKEGPGQRRKRRRPELKTVPLVPGPAVVVASNVNVRGQAKLKSEVLTRLTKGQAVTVLEEITRNNSGPDEPSAWAKIALADQRPCLGQQPLH